MRPEVAFVEDQIRAVSLRERVAAAGQYPSIYAQGGYSYTENEYQLHQDNTFLKLGAKVDLYDGGATTAAARKERLIRGQLQEQKNKLIEDIKLEIEDSYTGLKNAVEKLSVAQSVLAQAQENVRVFRVRYAEGAATQTEVLEAISLQTKAQTNYCNSSYEAKRGYAQLMYSMGIDLALIYEKMECEQNGSNQQKE
jgi:outer membrane protein TolC